MKKSIFSFCLVILLSSLIGCNSRNTAKEDEMKTEVSKVDINNLFIDIQEIESIKTLQIDIQYELVKTDQINELMEALEGIEYTESDNNLPDEEADGTNLNDVKIVFYYKNDTRRILYFFSTGNREFVRYTQVSYKPYLEEIRVYTIEEQVKDNILSIMKKGQKNDLNEKQ